MFDASVRFLIFSVGLRNEQYYSVLLSTLYCPFFVLSFKNSPRTSPAFRQVETGLIAFENHVMKNNMCSYNIAASKRLRFDVGKLLKP